MARPSAYASPPASSPLRGDTTGVHRGLDPGSPFGAVGEEAATNGSAARLDREVDAVNAFWDGQATAHALAAEKARGAMRARHVEERHELKLKLQSAPIKPRSSPDLLALRRRQATLSAAGEHVEAHRVKRKADALELAELTKAGTFHGGMMAAAQDKLACKQRDEVRALEERTRAGSVKLEQRRRRELEEAAKRYRAMMSREMKEAQRQRRLLAGSPAHVDSASIRGDGSARRRPIDGTNTDRRAFGRRLTYDDG